MPARYSPPSRSAITLTSVGRGHVDDGAQEEDEADQPVRTGEQRLGETRAAMARLGPMAQPVAVQAHERGFAAREEGGEDQEHAQRTEEDTESGVWHFPSSQPQCRPSTYSSTNFEPKYDRIRKPNPLKVQSTADRPRQP